MSGSSLRSKTCHGKPLMGPCASALFSLDRTFLEWIGTRVTRKGSGAEWMKATPSMGDWSASSDPTGTRCSLQLLHPRLRTADNRVPCRVVLSREPQDTSDRVVPNAHPGTRFGPYEIASPLRAGFSNCTELEQVAVLKASGNEAGASRDKVVLINFFDELRRIAPTAR